MAYKISKEPMRKEVIEKYLIEKGVKEKLAKEYAEKHPEAFKSEVDKDLFGIAKIENKKQEQKKLFLEDIKKRGTITEKEILLVKRRLNEGTYKDADVTDLYGLNLTIEQNTKGFNWLFDKWKSAKTGKERKDNPYGYREEEALRTFKKLKFNGFTNISTYGEFKNYVPLYRVEGDTNFEYYVQGGKISITG